MTGTEAREVAARAEAFVEDLQTWLRIPSISADPGHHGDVARSAAWLAERLRAEGWPQVEVWDDTDALPAVYASWPAADPGAPTVLVYGHHDVQPADLADGWSFEPFAPEVVGEELRGRGASDDKGHLAMVRLGLAAHLAATGADGPAVHLKLLAEGEEESGSAHLASLLAAHRDALACDAIVVTDTGMVGRDAPTVCTGMRGMVDTEVVFRGASVDLHSGQFGGAVPNPVTELARLVAALHDDRGRVQVPGFYDDVRPPTQTERDAWAALPFDEPAWLAGSAAGARATSGEAGWSTYERLWARPTAEVNGLHGGYARPRAQDDRAALGDREADVPAGRRPGAGARPRRRPRLRRRAHPGRDRGRGVGDRPGRPAADLRRRLAPRHHDPRGDGPRARRRGAARARGRQRPRGAPVHRARGPAGVPRRHAAVRPHPRP